MASEEYEKNPICVGPWGGQDGVRWDDGVYTTVRRLVITHGAGIDSIRVEYDNKGSSVWSEKHGGSGGVKVDKIKLDFPYEFLTSISGYYGSINRWGSIIVRSLTFQSNKKTYGPFGTEQGTHFSFPVTGSKIVGFHGWSGWYLDSIGVYLKPLKKSNSSQSFVANATGNFGYRIVQGNIGKDYDVVIAIRQKEDNNKVTSNNILKQISSSSEDESMEKVRNLPTLIKKDPIATQKFAKATPKKLTYSPVWQRY